MKNFSDDWLETLAWLDFLKDKKAIKEWNSSQKSESQRRE